MDFQLFLSGNHLDQNKYKGNYKRKKHYHRSNQIDKRMKEYYTIYLTDILLLYYY